MNANPSKIECLNVMCRNTIKRPLEKLLLYSMTCPTFQKLVNASNSLKTITANADDLASCLWIKYKKRSEGKESKSSENLKKRTMDHNFLYDKSGCYSLAIGAPPSYNKMYLALIMLSVLKARNYPFSSNHTIKNNFHDFSFYSNGTTSLRFRFGLHLIGKKDKMLTNILSKDYPFTISKTLLDHNLIKVNHNYENLPTQRFGKHKDTTVVGRCICRFTKLFIASESSVKEGLILNKQINSKQSVNIKMYPFLEMLTNPTPATVPHLEVEGVIEFFQ